MTRETARRRAAALVAEMTAEEKASQLLFDAPPIERLGIRRYNWWNEALHGVARAGLATVFPQAIAMAASFDPALLGRVAQAIALEGRAKTNAARAEDDRGIYKGLTYWSPNINIFRDPRWGRGHETYGEDPCLTALMGAAFVRGLQGDGDFMTAAACAKHYAVHSGPEALRHEFDACVDDQDLYETYLPAFEWLVKEAGVESVMGAYNRVGGEPCCGSRRLLKEILRGRWGFQGHVVSDCGAIGDFHLHHGVTGSAAESAALALKNGCDLNCGNMFGYLLQALAQGFITEDDLAEAATRLLTTRILLGEFEETDPFAGVGFDAVDCPEHQALNLAMAREAMVLLKNEGGFLPLSPEKLRTVAVIGPNAMSRAALEGNYCGTAGEYITVADGLRRALPDARLYYSEGCSLYKDKVESLALPDDRLSEAATLAKLADVTVLCVGLDPSIEGEEGDASNEYAAGDKRDIRLPLSQQRLVKAVCTASDNVVIVLLAGSSLDLGEDAASAKAVIQAWYPGARGGEAVAGLITGAYSPSGRLPVTFYRGDRPLPDMEDYRMEGRTYRFLREEPLYPFGYGLSYTTFAYADLQAAPRRTGEPLRASVTVSNTGGRTGAEVVQAYFHAEQPGLRTPRYQLCAVSRVELEPGESRRVTLEIPDYWLRIVSREGERILPDGPVTLYVGGHQPDDFSRKLTGTGCLSLTL